MKKYFFIFYICLLGFISCNDIYDIKIFEELLFEEVYDCSGYYFRVKVIDNTNKNIQLKVFNEDNPQFRVFVIGFNEFPSDDMINNSWEFIDISSTYSKTIDSLFDIYNFPFITTDKTEYLVFYVETPIYLNYLSISVNSDDNEELN